MLRINEYVKADSPDEAADLLKKKNTVIIGGMHWVKMQEKDIPVAVDISALGLDKITETDSEFVIGSAVTLRQIETHIVLNDFARNAIADAVKGIVGVQFRNTATVGGSIVCRSGFSDVITTFLALDATLHFYCEGDIRLCDFLGRERFNDLLMSVSIPKRAEKITYKSVRLNATDFSVLNVAVALCADKLRIVVGARPMIAKLIEVSIEDALMAKENSQIEEYVNSIAAEYDYESNMRGSKEYREHLARVLITRALEEIL